MSVSASLERALQHLAPNHLNESKAPRPPALVPEAVEECVELLRFICFPDMLRCPLAVGPGNDMGLSRRHSNIKEITDATEFCQTSSGVGESHKTGPPSLTETTSTSPPRHFCHVQAVQRAMMRFAKVLEEQLLVALYINEYEQRLSIQSCIRTPSAGGADARKTGIDLEGKGKGVFVSNGTIQQGAQRGNKPKPARCDFLEFPTAALLGIDKSFNIRDDEEFKRCCQGLQRKAHTIVANLVERIPKLKVLLSLDVEATFLHDVAAESIAEVIICYPGVQCLIHHRLAHELLMLGAPSLFSRLISETSHSKFGIDIHPQTTIGHSCFLDHGTGIVIGATAIIGNRVSIYQGATLGAKAFPVDPVTGIKIKSLPRHPIIEDDVVIYANATVLGRITIGRNSVLAGSVWVDRDVPPNSLVAQKPMIITRTKGNNSSKSLDVESSQLSKAPPTPPPTPASSSQPPPLHCRSNNGVNNASTTLQIGVRNHTSFSKL